MEILSVFDFDSKTIYTVGISSDKAIDISVSKESGLMYIMENADGSIVYEIENPDHTFPEKSVDENFVFELIRNTIKDVV